MFEGQVTSIEQSNKLISLGIPAENASMVWTTVNGHKTVVDRDLCLPENIEGYAFTVADLMGIIPNPFMCEGKLYYLSIIKTETGYYVKYYCKDNNDSFAILPRWTEIINVLFDAYVCLMNKTKHILCNAR